MSTSHVEKTSLTSHQQLVLNALADAKGPLSAYTLLDRLREHGFRAPLQVYRALDKLVEFGLVHRLESLNAFVACQHPSCVGDKSENVLFAICEQCGNVQELSSQKLLKTIGNISGEAGFSLKESVIELRGQCSGCAVNH